MKSIIGSILCVLVGCTDEPNLGNTLAEPSTQREVILGTGPTGAMDLAIDQTYVYWVVTESTDFVQPRSTVLRVPKRGGTIEELTQVDAAIYQLALDESSIYLPTYSQRGLGQLLRLSKDGTSTAVLADQLGWLAMVATDETGVYVSPCVSQSPIDYQLWRYPTSGGTPTILVDGLRGPDSIAYDASSIYATNMGDGRLVAAPREGGQATEPIPGLDAARVVADSSNLYFLSAAIDTCADGRISSWPRSGDLLTDLGASPTCGIDVALTNESLFSAEAETGKIVAFPLDGTGRNELVSNLERPTAIAAERDGSAVYWVDSVTGEVDRLDLQSQPNWLSLFEP